MARRPTPYVPIQYIDRNKVPAMKMVGIKLNKYPKDSP